MSEAFVEGTIIIGVGGHYTVRGDDCQEYQCMARGRFRREGMTPMVGDRVHIQPGAFEQEGRLESILPRKNQLHRPMVANIDQMALVFSATTPEPDLLLGDRLLVQALDQGITPLIVINKCDGASEGKIEDLCAQYKPAGWPVLRLSAQTGEGVEAFVALLGHGTACLAGQSGVGKTSILQCVFPERLELLTGDLSQRIQRGRHTTRHATLLPLPNGGMVVDTPGFSILEMNAMPPERLQEYYPEMQPFIGQCFFQSCLHDGEPRCAVKDAVEHGAMSAPRHERYQVLLAQVMEKWRNQYD